MSFDLPFGLIALSWAAGPAAQASGVLRSAGVNRDFGTLVRAAGE
jgi:hypothetical protein